MNQTEKAKTAALQAVVWARSEGKPLTRDLIDAILSRDASTPWGDANVRTVRMWVRKFAVLPQDEVALTDREEVAMYKSRFSEMTYDELHALRDEVRTDENHPMGWNKNFSDALSWSLR